MSAAIGRRIAAVALAVAALAALGGTATTELRPSCRSATCSRVPALGASDVLVGEASPIRVRGGVARPLVPGRSAPVDLHLVNRRSYPVVVTRLTVVITRIVAPGAGRGLLCTLRDFAVHQARHGLRVHVGAHRTVRLSTSRTPRSDWPHLVMIDRPLNQDGCQAAVLRLRYSAIARQASS